MSILCLSAAALILSNGPTSVGLMIPAAAASATPRSELSSQGCTTMVAAAGIAFAAAMRRSYFLPGLASPASRGATLMSSSNHFQRLRRLRLRPGGQPEQLCHAIEPSGGLARDFFSTCGQHLTDDVQTGATFRLARRQQLWDGGEARLRLQQQHEE